MNAEDKEFYRFNGNIRPYILLEITFEEVQVVLHKSLAL